MINHFAEQSLLSLNEFREKHSQYLERSETRRRRHNIRCDCENLNLIIYNDIVDDDNDIEIVLCRLVFIRAFHLQSRISKNRSVVLLMNF